jgi:hypothetical protein
MLILDDLRENKKKPLFPGACIYVQLSGLVIEGQPQLPEAADDAGR